MSPGQATLVTPLLQAVPHTSANYMEAMIAQLMMLRSRAGTQQPTPQTSCWPNGGGLAQWFSPLIEQCRWNSWTWVCPIYMWWMVLTWT